MLHACCTAQKAMKILISILVISTLVLATTSCQSIKPLRPSQSALLPVGSIFSDTLDSGAVGPKMVVVPAGSFKMGCVSGRNCKNTELPVVDVEFSEPFAISVFEVSFDEYALFARSTNRRIPRDMGWGRGTRPVVNVDWFQAMNYTRWLSQKTGQLYNLPTEAEWEYVARAGSSTQFSWGDRRDCEKTSCTEVLRSEQSTDPVGVFPPNAWGVFDMEGNVFEWVRDCWQRSHNKASPEGKARGHVVICMRHVVRGGGFNLFPFRMRTAQRTGHLGAEKSSVRGFRIVRYIPQ